MELKTVLVPVKGDKSDIDALGLACDLVKHKKGRVIALYVIQVERRLPVDAEIETATAKGEDVLKHVEESVKEYKCNLEAELLQAREIGPAVVQEALERGVEAIVMGIPYKRRYGSFSLGDDIPYILSHAPCRVILWREPMEENSKGGNLEATYNMRNGDV